MEKEEFSNEDKKNTPWLFDLQGGRLLKGKYSGRILFTGKTDEENSLVCLTADVPDNTLERDDGWRAFRIQGVLDFSLVGILSEITGILAEDKIGIFAISTFNTDYILTKKENYQKALDLLDAEGYKILE